MIDGSVNLLCGFFLGLAPAQGAMSIPMMAGFRPEVHTLSFRPHIETYPRFGGGFLRLAAAPGNLNLDLLFSAMGGIRTQMGPIKA